MQFLTIKLKSDLKSLAEDASTAWCCDDDDDDEDEYVFEGKK